jgi:undecaprenyl-diphosphatase
LERGFLNQLNNKLNADHKDFYNKIQKSDKNSTFLLIAIYLLIAATTLASYMIWHYNSYGQWAMDGAMQGLMVGIRVSWLTDVFKGITATGETMPVIIATLIIIMIFVICKRYKEVVLTALYMLGVWRLNEFLKGLLHRPRIDASLHLIDISEYSNNNQFSLPSGHSMNFMALVLLSLYFIWIFSSNKKLNWGLTILLLIYGLLVGISRVYLNVHYFSDVVTGWSIGAACAAMAAILHSFIGKTKYNR